MRLHLLLPLRSTDTSGRQGRRENAKKSEQLRATVMDALAHEFKTR